MIYHNLAEHSFHRAQKTLPFSTKTADIIRNDEWIRFFYSPSVALALIFFFSILEGRDVEV